MTVMQVAIKKMKKEFRTWEECMELNEVRVRGRQTSSFWHTYSFR